MKAQNLVPTPSVYCSQTQQKWAMATQAGTSAAAAMAHPQQQDIQSNRHGEETAAETEEKDKSADSSAVEENSKEKEKGKEKKDDSRIEYISYKDETQLPEIMALIDQELSEPYSIFTYRYFITLWPDLCFMVGN